MNKRLEKIIYKTDEKYFDSELNEYKIIKETESGYFKQLYWDFAIGLQKVDGLTPSKYLIDISNKNINDEISDEQVEILLKKYYSDKNLKNEQINNERECDLVSSRIVSLINEGGFSFHPTTLKSIHKYLFNEIYQFFQKKKS